MIHPERDDWARQLTALRQQMAEQAASLDASGEFPWRNIDHLRAGGWLSLAVPPSCGGAGASLAQLQQVIAAIAWGEPATALIVCMQYLHHLRLAENTPGTRRCASRFFTMLSNTVASSTACASSRSWAPRRGAACRTPWRPVARRAGTSAAIKFIPPALKGCAGWRCGPEAMITRRWWVPGWCLATARVSRW